VCGPHYTYLVPRIVIISYKMIFASRIVRALTHRLPSDSGHLSFNEGDKLRVVLEVDDKYLLCCSGARKGLVPKNAVIPVN